MHYVYILACADGTLYTGWTTNISARLATHNKGKGAKYTRGRLPVTLVYHEAFEDKSSALKREHAIKKLTLSQKLDLVRSGKAPSPMETAPSRSSI
ncbi:MAG: GIY-YIG nuclease family protein [Anaerovoracaceae bacterium]